MLDLDGKTRICKALHIDMSLLWLVGYLLRRQDPRHVLGCIFQDRAAICALVMVDDVLCGGCSIGDQVRIARLSTNRISTCLTEAYLRTWNVIGPRPISAPEDEVASTWGDRVDILVHLPVEEGKDRIATCRAFP